MQALNNFIILKKEQIEEKKTESGIVIYSEQFEKQEFTGRNIEYFRVVSANKKEKFLQTGDKVIINPEIGFDLDLEGQKCRVILMHQYLAKVDEDGNMIVPPRKVMVRIKKEDRESLFSKWIVKDDGQKVQLFITVDAEDKSDERRSSLFVSMGVIEGMGSEVTGIEIGDTALLDYLTDNSDDNIVQFDKNGDKLIIIDAITTFHDKDEWTYANREKVYDQKKNQWFPKNNRDRLVYKKGDMDEVSPLLGVISGDKLMSRQPYAFIEHLSNEISKVSSAGLLYTEKQQVFRRKLLSADSESIKKYNLNLDEEVLVKDEDVFDVKLENGQTVQCIMDSDILIAYKEIKNGLLNS